ncbi:MAG: LppP/LprE family lipoprotein [Chloroflexota bacterium]
MDERHLARSGRGGALAILAIGLCTALFPAPVIAQQPAWLDGALESWNVTGMALPGAAQGMGFGPPQCQVRVRPPAGAEEMAVAGAGWQLTLDWPAQSRGDTTVVMATGDFDGMCRPLGFNAFVFAGGRFAGTVAREPMGTRSDGTLGRPPAFLPDGRLDAYFLRFEPADPRCCPSRPQTRLLYRVERSDEGPVLMVERPGTGGLRLPGTGGGWWEAGGRTDDPNAGDSPCSTLDR